MTLFKTCLKISVFEFYKINCKYRIAPLFLERILNLSTRSEGELPVEITMAGSPKRYFVNELPDYQESTPSCLKVDELKSQILQLISQIESKQQPSPKHADGGLYVGIAGIAYMFLYLSKSPIFIDKRDDFISKGLEYIIQAEKYQNKKAIRDVADVTGFLLGGSGVNAVAACLYHSAGERKAMEFSISQFTAAGKKCKPIHFLSYGGDELLVGRAGYVSGTLWLKRMFNHDIVTIEDLIDICKSMYDSGVEYAQANKSPSPLMYSYYDTEYLGAAHGLSTILQMIISVPEFVQKYPNTMNNIKAAVDFMLSLQTPDGNFPCAMDEIGQRVRSSSDELVHWCHGAPGVVYLMAKAYLLWHDQKYLDSCLKCGELTWKKGLLKKGPGICHGVAGNGYVFLLLYRLTGDKKHLHRAHQFANFIFSKQFQSARTPDSPYSLYEGIAGTICFLNDVLIPDKAEFPFLNVFV